MFLTHFLKVIKLSWVRYHMVSSRSVNEPLLCSFPSVLSSARVLGAAYFAAKLNRGLFFLFRSRYATVLYTTVYSTVQRISCV